MPQARRPSPQAIARRRAGQKRLGLLLAGVLIVIAVVIASTGHSPAKARNSALRRTKTAKTHAPVAMDPLTTTAVNRWIADRTGDVSAAVLNLNTGKEWLLNPGARDQTASIIKADILETLLYQTRKDDDSIADAEGEVRRA